MTIDRLLTFPALLWLAFAPLCQAQTPPAFEVVSIKPNRTGARSSGFHRAGGGNLNAINVTLKTLIGYAYDVRGYQISGGPPWIDSERYDILAKPEGTELDSRTARVELMRHRVQALLADRFQLTITKTTKELPMFTLVVAKNGPKLTRAKGDDRDMVTNGHHLTCRTTSMESLAKNFLQGELGRFVADRTGLKGEFDFTLDWAPQEGEPRQSDGEPSTVPEGASLFMALQEQLGLKLEPTKGPVEILVVDHAERASEN
jgi:bla regulator protein BlaR1